MTWAVIVSFLEANWFWLLLGYFGLCFVCKIFDFTGKIFKVAFFPVWLILEILSPGFRAIRKARTERKNANRIE